MPFALTRSRSFGATRRILALLITLSGSCVWSQVAPPIPSEPDQSWAGQRIVTLRGFGDYFALGANGQPRLVNPEGLGVNIVAVVAKVEADRIWIRANGAGKEPVGWVNKGEAILLDNAVPYFASRIDPVHKTGTLIFAALNQNTPSINATLLFRITPGQLNCIRTSLFCSCVGVASTGSPQRRRRKRPVKRALGLPLIFRKRPVSIPSGLKHMTRQRAFTRIVPIPAGRDPQKAIVLIERAIALSPNPAYLTVLALAYFRSGNLERAVTTQKQALASPGFPPGYREEALRQLQQYQSALAAQKR